MQAPPRRMPSPALRVPLPAVAYRSRVYQTACPPRTRTTEQQWPEFTAEDKCSNVNPK